MQASDIQLTDDHISDGFVGSTALLVLGMHRSGTSAFTGMLNRLGVELGSSLLPADFDNPKGFFEHAEIVALHNSVLSVFETGWDDPRPLPLNWARDPRLEPLRDQLAGIIRRDFEGKRLWGVKDPRLCLLLPFWRPVLEKLNVTAKAAFVVRSPGEIAASLAKRNRISADQAAMLWLSYYVAAERDSRGLARSIVLYQDLLRDWQGVAAQLRHDLQINFFALSDNIIEEINGFLEAGLRHHRHKQMPPTRAPQNKWTQDVYDALLAWQRDGTEPGRICDEANKALVYASESAAPITSYLRSAARAGLAAQSELLAQSEAEQQAIRGEFARIQEHHAAALRQCELLEAQLDLVRKELSAACADREESALLRARLETAERELAAAQGARDETVEMYKAAETRRSEIAAYASALRLELGAIKASTSWRLSLPARRLLGRSSTVAAAMRAARRLSGLPVHLRAGSKPARTTDADRVVLSGEIDLSWYIRNNPDVIAAGFDPVEHYIQHGKKEGREPRPAAQAVSDVPRIEIAPKPPGSVSLVSSPLSKDAAEIAASAYFDAEWYLENYPEVAGTGIDPATHYLVSGALERRDPGPEFETSWYLEQYSDVAESGVNPLLHYIRYGDAEGRLPNSRQDRFQVWARRYDTLSDADRELIRSHIARLRRKPLISVVMPVYETPEKLLREAIESVRAQLYPAWELCIADDASSSPHVRAALATYAAEDPRIKVVFRPANGHIVEASNSALELARGEFVALMDHDDILPEHALYEIAVELEAHPDADLIYSDEDQIDESGRRVSAYFKPDWNPELFLAQNMVSHLGVYRKSLVDRLGGFRPGFEGSQDHDLALRVVAVSAPERIRHIPAVLYHWRRDTGTFSETWLDRCADAARRAVGDYLRAREPFSAEIEVMPAPHVSNHIRVRYPIPDPAPLVSVIVPTRDRPELLSRCVEGLLRGTNYASLELILIDNDSSDPEAINLLSDLRSDSRVRVLPFAGGFNYSAMNNFAVREANGQILVLLNNDVEVIEADWLRELVSHAVRPEIGAVGAKLLYPDRTVQHAGLVVGAAGVAHGFHTGLRADEPGYFGCMVLKRNVSAVTAACMAIRRDVFVEVGGFDERNLPVAFNDVDLCLRIRERGYQIVWTPYAELYHHESASRGPDEKSARQLEFKREIAYMQRKWASQLAADPFYNPNFSNDRADFNLAFPPRRKKPWLAAG